MSDEQARSTYMNFQTGANDGDIIAVAMKTAAVRPEGPAMSDTTPDAKGPAPVQLAAETTDPALIPADQVKPEDVGTLSIEYRDGQPVIVVSGGKYISAGLAVLDRSGQPAATYTITSSQSPEPGRGSYMRRIEISKDNTTIIDGSGEAITIEAR